MSDKKADGKAIPCAVCGKPLKPPPWPIVAGSLQCLEHSGPVDDATKELMELAKKLNERKPGP